MKRLFGTDGIRGIYRKEPITEKTFRMIGAAISDIIRAKKKQGRFRVVIGRDTRQSGEALERAILSGIRSGCGDPGDPGVDIISCGILTTPGVAFVTREAGADIGIVVSASHNPYNHNGIKVFGSDGFKIPDEMEEEIERLIFTEIEGGNVNADFEAGEITPQIYKKSADSTGADFYIKKYIENLTSIISGKIDMRVVVDCANGAACKIAGELFTSLDIDAIIINSNPDGRNINLNCGAVHPGHVSEAVIKEGADMGVAFDGDADRVIFVDERGDVVDGDSFMALCASYMKNRGELTGGGIAATVMGNMGLDIAMREIGVDVIRTPVGDRFVVEAMRAHGYNFGGEQSGHIIFMDHSTTGDGIASALKMIQIAQSEGKKISELAGAMKKLPQVLINVDVRKKEDLDNFPEIKNLIEYYESKLTGKGRILVRFSGTEMLCRVMVEGEREDEIEKIAGELAGVIEKYLG